MFGLLKKIFGSKPTETTTEVPYKGEVAVVKEEVPPAVAPVTSVAEKATEAVVKSVAPAPKKPAPKKQQFAKKPAAPKTAKPKAPRKPKAKPAA